MSIIVASASSAIYEFLSVLNRSDGNWKKHSPSNQLAPSCNSVKVLHSFTEKNSWIASRLCTCTSSITQESKTVLLKFIRCRDDFSSIKCAETTYEVGINSDTITTQHQLHVFNSAFISVPSIVHQTRL